MRCNILSIWTFVKEFDTNLYVAGVIPFMLESGDAVDQEMYKQAQEIYGNI